MNPNVDQIGDGVVDLHDYNIFRLDCYLQGPFSRDDQCAIADINQDTDVDLDDFNFFLQAYDVALPDCNTNSQPDLLDILVGTSPDVDVNGVPDECECVDFDLNCDGNVDLVDYGMFLRCVTGPAGMLDGPICIRADSDSNGNVDLLDFRQFQIAFTSQ